VIKSQESPAEKKFFLAATAAELSVQYKTVDGSLKKPALSGTLLCIFCLCRLVSGSDLCCSSSFCCCMVILFYFLLKTVVASMNFWSLFFFLGVSKLIFWVGFVVQELRKSVREF
jgi:hypothetical protein